MLGGPEQRVEPPHLGRALPVPQVPLTRAQRKPCSPRIPGRGSGEGWLKGNVRMSTQAIARPGQAVSCYFRTTVPDGSRKALVQIRAGVRLQSWRPRSLPRPAYGVPKACVRHRAAATSSEGAPEQKHATRPKVRPRLTVCSGESPRRLIRRYGRLTALPMPPRKVG
jgi:hypothetical protein